MSQLSFVFTENCLAIVFSERKSQTLSTKHEHTEMACLKLQRKNFIFTRRKIDEEELLLMIA